MNVMVHLRRSTASVILVAAALAPQGCGQAPPPEGAEAPAAPPRAAATQYWWRDPDAAASLSLTQDQISALEAALAARSHEAAEVRRAERQAYVQLLRALRNAPEAPERVTQAQAILEELALRRHRLQISRLTSTREVLSLDQWEQLRQTVPDALSLGSFRPFATARREITAEDPPSETADPPHEGAATEHGSQP